MKTPDGKDLDELIKEIAEFYGIKVIEKTPEELKENKDYPSPEQPCNKKPPIGLTPKNIHDEKVNLKRFTEVYEAIERYYGAGLKINVEWIEEYNELLDVIAHDKIN